MRENITIEDRLHSAGYKTERIGGVVVVHDPVYRACGKDLILDSWNLVEIRSIKAAWNFIEARS